MHRSAYHLAQRAVTDLKQAVLEVIINGPERGISNAELGKNLGIHEGHVGHEGHITRTILSMLEEEGVVKQEDESKLWKLKRTDGLNLQKEDS